MHDPREAKKNTHHVFLTLCLRHVARVSSHRAVKVVQGATVVSEADVHQSAVAVQVREAHVAFAGSSEAPPLVGL